MLKTEKIVLQKDRPLEIKDDVIHVVSVILVLSINLVMVRREENLIGF